jgi:hypothetical protein
MAGFCVVFGGVRVRGSMIFSFISLITAFSLAPTRQTFGFRTWPSTHIIATGSFLLVARRAAGASFVVVGCADMVTVCPTVCIVVDDAWRALWLLKFLTHWLTDQRKFGIHGFFQILKFVVEHGHEFLLFDHVVVAVGRCRHHKFRCNFHLGCM